jgi:hypothetical protein
VDRRQIELQIRIIRVTYRGEVRRSGSAAMQDFRARALVLIAEIEAAAREADLIEAIRALRREIGVDDDGLAPG